jgi:hypothetical protein
MSRHRTIIAIASILLGACSAPTAPTAFTAPHSPGIASIDAGPLGAQYQQAANAGDGEDGFCSFSRGVTTCVTTTQHQETGSHVEYSGCRYGPSGVPGRRSRTFSDTYLVTVMTTTLRRGRSDHVFSTQTTTSRQLIGSTQISDVCEPI